jgi:hypothetical protein
MFRSAVVCVVVVVMAAFNGAYASPAVMAEMRSMCNDESDSFSCMKYKVISYLENILKKDDFQVSAKTFH